MQDGEFLFNLFSLLEFVMSCTDPHAETMPSWRETDCNRVCSFDAFPQFTIQAESTWLGCSEEKYQLCTVVWGGGRGVREIAVKSFLDRIALVQQEDRICVVLNLC